MESVYLETSFISYIVSKASRDLLVAAHQQVSQHWWDMKKESFECFVSQVVLEECGAGDKQEALRRLDLIKVMPVLEVTDEAKALAKSIIMSGAYPPQAVGDAAHVAIAAVNWVTYLLTWNCKHLANAQVIRRVAALVNKMGYNMPVVCTPEELLGD